MPKGARKAGTFPTASHANRSMKEVESDQWSPLSRYPAAGCETMGVFD